ncbi:MAG: hypothetical protein ACSLEZ_10330 [Thiobacillus sp.]
MEYRSVDLAARSFAVVNAVIWAVLAFGWSFRADWAVRLLPWPEVPMTFVFLASIGASIAAVWLAVAWAREWAALSGVGLNIVVAGTGSALHLLLLGRPWLAASAALAAGFGLLLYGWARRQPVKDPRAMPRLVRWAFMVFTVVLIVAGGALVAQRQVFPWRMQPSTMVLVGAIFLGAAAYFAHGAANPRWAHAAPPLWGFLLYDLVLFVPYLRLLGADTGGVDDYYGDGGGAVNRTSLAIYLTVLSVSAALAVYALFVNPATRGSASSHEVV